MTTQYSPILKLALPVQGELSGTWGDVVNDNITSMVEQAIAGRAVINTWSTNSHTLTSANGTTSESRCAMLELTDTGTSLSAAGTVICPALSKIYIVKNAAGQNVTVKTASGTGILVPNGRTTFLFCDGTNVVEAMTHTTSLQLGTSTTVTAVLDEDNMASNSATSLATQQSIKAYVDAQVGAFDSLAEVLAVGNTTGGTDLAVSTGDDITFADSSKAIFGAGSDLQIYHDGSNSFIKDTGTGSLYIQGQQAIILANADATEFYATFDVNGASTLRYDNGQKLATTSTGINVTGTVTADGLTVDGNTTLNTSSTLFANFNYSGSNLGKLSTDGVNVNIEANSNLLLKANSATRAKFDGNGDISFYEDTGTTAKFFWDASAERLGLGTSSPDRLLHLSSNAAIVCIEDTGGATNDKRAQLQVDNGQFEINSRNDDNSSRVDNIFVADLGTGQVGIGTSSPTALLHLSSSAPSILMQDSDGTGRSSINCDNGSLNLKFNSNNAVGTSVLTFNDFNTERMRIDSSGNVGIGTDNPAGELEVKSTGDADLYIRSGDSNAGSIYFASASDSQEAAIRYFNSNNSLRFYGHDMAEAMRIDASGNVGIGISSPSAKLEVAGDVKLGAVNPMQTATNVVHGTSGQNGFSIRTAVSGATTPTYSNVDDTNTGMFFPVADTLGITTGGTERMRIDASGNVGIGTSSPTNVKTQINGSLSSTAGTGHLAFGETSTPFWNWRLNTSSADLILDRSYAGWQSTPVIAFERSSGNVGIGTDSPSEKLHVAGTIIGQSNDNYFGNYSSGAYVDIGNLGTTEVYLDTRSSSLGSVPMNFRTKGSGNFKFIINTSERMRIDSSGNLLVGTTDAAVGVGNTGTGLSFGNSGYAAVSRTGSSSQATLYLNKNTNDGTIVDLRKDGTTVGSIGTLTADPWIARANGCGVRFITAAYIPSNATGNNNGDAVDLGAPTVRFKDAYLSGGVYLGGTGSANKLDDYESGTWTPTLKAQNGTKTWTYNGRSGKYIKVGNIVTAWFSVQLSSNGSGTDGNAYVDGLPFTSANEFSVYSLAWKQLIETGDVGLMLRLQHTHSYFFMIDGSSSYPDVEYINTSVLVNDRRFRGQFTYQTS